MKSAYELALERMEKDGIERPHEEALSGETKAQMAEVRSRAEAKLAEIEILNKKTATVSTEDAGQHERNYWRERERIESDRDRELEVLRRKRR